MYKTKEDVLRVISLNKPEKVIDMFIESYLLGEALQPYFDVEEEYVSLKAQEDSPDVEPVFYEESGEVVTDGYSPNGIRDERIGELEVEYGYLISVEDALSTVESRRPIPEVDVPAWKVENYSVLRQAAYGSWGEQLDKQYEGTWEAHVLAVKEKYPKPQLQT